MARHWRYLITSDLCLLLCFNTTLIAQADKAASDRLSALTEKAVKSDFTAALKLSASHLDIPESLVVSLILAYPKGYSVNRSSLRQNLLYTPPWESSAFKLLLEEDRLIQVEDEVQLRIDYTLQPQKVGRFPIAFREILFSPHQSQDSAVSVLSDMAYIEISLPSEISPANPPIDPPLDLTNNLPLHWQDEEAWLSKMHRTLSGSPKGKAIAWLMIGVLLILGVLAFGRHQKRRRPAPAPIDVKLKNLESISETDRLISSLHDEFNRLLAEKFHLQLSTKTRAEIMQDLNKALLPRDLKEHIHRFLQGSERLKFAHHSPSPAELQQLIDQLEGIKALIMRPS